jgi:hypothetical protein
MRSLLFFLGGFRLPPLCHPVGTASRPQTQRTIASFQAPSIAVSLSTSHTHSPLLTTRHMLLRATMDSDDTATHNRRHSDRENDAAIVAIPLGGLLYLVTPGQTCRAQGAKGCAANLYAVRFTRRTSSIEVHTHSLARLGQSGVVSATSNQDRDSRVERFVLSR